MAKFVKKLIEVEASQWFPGNGCPGVMDDLPWTLKTDVTYSLCGCVMLGGPHSGKPHVHPTRCDSGVPVEPGDWVIAEGDGSGFYPCKPDVFSATYEGAPGEAAVSKEHLLERLENLVAMIEMDDEANDPGTDLYVEVLLAREALKGCGR